jgi:hypothetical protein
MLTKQLHALDPVMGMVRRIEQQREELRELHQLMEESKQTQDKVRDVTPSPAGHATLTLSPSLATHTHTHTRIDRNSERSPRRTTSESSGS